MKPLQQWLDEYGVSHQNPTNKMVHWVCVPAIMFSLMGLLMSIPFPIELNGLFANWAGVVVLASLLFYLRLSFVMFLSMTLVLTAMLWGNYYLYTRGINTVLLSLTLFVLAWIGQFWGHKIEGQKPSFLEDVKFLLIGPAWLMHFIYRKLGIKY